MALILPEIGFFWVLIHLSVLWTLVRGIFWPRTPALITHENYMWPDNAYR